MTLLGRVDGDSHQRGVSYLDLAGFILQNGNKDHIASDLEELWRRIGFMLRENGWRLSPAYDINAVPTGTGLSLNISDEDNSLDLELVSEVAEFFRLTPNKAKDIIKHVQKNVSKWKSIATHYGLSRREQELMSLAFE